MVEFIPKTQSEQKEGKWRPVERSTRVSVLQSNSSFQGESLASSKLRDHENFVPPREVLLFRVPAEFQFRPSQRL